LRTPPRNHGEGAPVQRRGVARGGHLQLAPAPALAPRSPRPLESHASDSGYQDGPGRHGGVRAAARGRPRSSEAPRGSAGGRPLASQPTDSPGRSSAHRRAGRDRASARLDVPGQPVGSGGVDVGRASGRGVWLVQDHTHRRRLSRPTVMTPPRSGSVLILQGPGAANVGQRGALMLSMGSQSTWARGFDTLLSASFFISAAVRPLR